MIHHHVGKEGRQRHSGQKEEHRQSQRADKKYRAFYKLRAVPQEADRTMVEAGVRGAEAGMLEVMLVSQMAFPCIT